MIFLFFYLLKTRNRTYLLLIYKCLIYVFLSLLGPVQAGFKEDMASTFNRLGVSSNVTESGSFRDQSAGYYNGGSLISRIQPRNTQLASLQLPSYRAGCGGIDTFMGGFSHIKASEFMNALRSIGSSVATYAFLLSLETMSPQIYNIINELNALATKINSMNVHSCETAATMIGAVWPKSDIASQHLCRTMGSSLGSFSDFAQARQNCGAGGRRDTILSHKDQQEPYKKILVGEYNIAWKALQDYDFLKSDPKLAEVFMTLSGTLIARKKDQGAEIVFLPSKADQTDVMHALLDGGSAPLYRCGQDQEKCLHPTIMSTTLEGGFRNKVQTMLQSMSTKIYDDTPLSKEEINFLNTTRLPVYKILNVLTSFKKGNVALDIQEYADLIALDILYQYIMDVFDLIHQNLTRLKNAQVDDQPLKAFQRGLQNARSRLVEKRTSVFEHLQAALSLIQKTQHIEKHLHSTFTLTQSD